MYYKRCFVLAAVCACAFTELGAAGAGTPPPPMLLAPVQETGSLFGYSLSLSGDRIAVGAAFVDSGNLDKAGIVYVYDYRHGQWAYSAAIQPTDPSANAWFGTLALQGNRLLVGASRKNGSFGAAYVFDRIGGAWQQRVKFEPLDPVINCDDVTYRCLFGNAVALDGNTAVVGAPTEKTRIGAVYVYTRNPTTDTWSLQRRLEPNDPAVQTQFGNAVALSGNTLVVGAHFATINGNDDQGAAYVFERNDQNQWTQTARLTANDGTADDIFGFDVAIDRNTIVVGARLADLPGQPHRGAAYVFERSGASWPQTARLDASDGVGVGGADGDHFGYRVSIRGDEAWITRHPGDGNIPAPDTNGAVYRFVRGAGGWTEAVHLTPANGSPGDSFGVSVDFNPSWLVVGAQNEGTPPEVEKRGAVYVYERVPGDRIFADGHEGPG